MLHHKGYTGHAEFDDEARLFHGEEPEEAGLGGRLPGVLRGTWRSCRRALVAGRMAEKNSEHRTFFL
jgi:hypothetical protein